MLLKTGNQLRAARMLAGLTQGELAQRCGIHLNSISAMEKRGAETPHKWTRYHQRGGAGPRIAGDRIHERGGDWSTTASQAVKGKEIEEIDAFLIAANDQSRGRPCSRRHRDADRVAFMLSRLICEIRQFRMASFFHFRIEGSPKTEAPAERLTFLDDEIEEAYEAASLGGPERPLRMEKLGGRGETVRKIYAALDASGVEFIEENGGGTGIRLRKRIHKASPLTPLRPAAYPGTFISSGMGPLGSDVNRRRNPVGVHLVLIYDEENPISTARPRLRAFLSRGARRKPA